MKKIIIIIAIILLFSLENVAFSQQSIPKYRIEIDIISRTLYFYENNNIIKKYPVAVGKASTQTPIGEYKVINKVVNPYYAKKKIAGGSPQNPLGSRWMGFKPSYGVHGNSNPKSIGTFVSEGCVRMYDKDVKELYEKVTIGTPVTVLYEPIKIENDIENNNPIIIVYPDTYKKVPNLARLVDEKLAQLNLTKKIDDNKLSKLKKQLNKEVVVFSDKWIYMINGNYITNDVISMENVLYVNLDKICNFLNIDIIANETTEPTASAEVMETTEIMKTTESVTILNNNISVVEYNGNRYVQMSLLENNLGGTHKIHQDQQTINLDLSYILYNSRFVKGGVIDIEGDVAISLDGINNILYGGLNNSAEKASVSINNKEIGYQTISGNPYILLRDLLTNTNFKSNTYTKDKYIEIVSDSYVIYDGTTYKGIIKNRDFFMPKELLVKVLYDYQIYSIDNCECLATIQSLLKENAEYYNINRLPVCYKITKEYYNTKFFLSKKMCP